MRRRDLVTFVGFRVRPRCGGYSGWWKEVSSFGI
jgi:hypothetical protein